MARLSAGPFRPWEVVSHRTLVNQKTAAEMGKVPGSNTVSSALLFSMRVSLLETMHEVKSEEALSAPESPGQQHTAVVQF